MMDHEQGSRLLVERFLGRLDPAARVEVDEHAGSCADCRGALEMLRILGGPRRSGSRPGGSSHLSSDRIAALSLEADPAGSAPDDAEEAHLASCASCSAEVAACRGAVAEARAGRGAPRRRARPFIPAALAASLLVAILGYPAYLGVVGLPRARREIEARAASEDRARAESGALQEALREERAAPGAPAAGGVVLALYLDVTRSAAGTPPAIGMRPEAALVAILLETAVLDKTSPTDRLRFEITDGTGRLAWSTEATSGALKDPGAADRLLSLFVPAAALPPGGFTLALHRLGDTGAETLMTAPFRTTAIEAQGAPRP